MTMEIITKALEEHATAVSGMGDSIVEMKDRLLSLEQKSAGGAMAGGSLGGGAWGSSHGQGALLKVLNKSDSITSYLAGETPRAKTSVDTPLLFKNTILGESGTPQEPDGVLVQPQRRPGVVAGAFRSLNVLDFIPTEATSSSMVEYTRELSWVNNAGETSEGAQKPESDLTFELVQDPVRTIPHFIRVSKQAWEDSPWLQNYTTERMRHGVRRRLQNQIINGDGTSPNLAGITNVGRHTAFTPTSGETELDALNRAKYTLEDADFPADFVIISPSTWGAIERRRRGTNDDAFTLGEGGAAPYVAAGLPGVVWGLPVVWTSDLATNKFIMASREGMRIITRQEATVEMFEEDADNVQKNLLTIRAELRAAFAVMLPASVLYGDLTG